MISPSRPASLNVPYAASSAVVDALRNVRRADALHGRHLAEGVIEHVAPVAEHVGDDPTAILGAVVPRRALRRLPVALEHPVAELAAHAEDAAEESSVHETLELPDAGKEQLVLHDTVLHARLVGESRQIERFVRT